MSLETLASTPSSSPPTTPTSISRIFLASTDLASRRSAISRFSSTGTAEPSHMCDWNSGSMPFLTRFSRSHSIRGSTQVGRTSLAQWSVCSATLIG